MELQQLTKSLGNLINCAFVSQQKKQIGNQPSMVWFNKSIFCSLLFFSFNLAVVFGQIPDSIPQNISDKTPTVIPKEIIVDSTLLIVPEQLPPSVVLLDTSQVKKKRGFLKRWFKDDYPSPKKAVWMSLVLPGSGQFYNKDYWKMPIVYGAYFFGINNIIVNRNSYVELRDEYIARLDDDPNTVGSPKFAEITNAADIKRFRDGFRSQMEVGWIILIGVHLIQTADAFVFAHLNNFDIDDDISLRIDPVIQYEPNNQSSLSVNLSFQFNPPTVEKPIPFFGD